MTDGYFDIILFAMVAVFLVLRLRSVLGRRTGLEQQRDPLAPPPAKAPVPVTDNVVTLPDRTAAPAPAGPMSVEAGVGTIRGADASFDPKVFLGGARAAFEMIVGAFAAGDTATLRPLLSDDVYEGFAEAIRARVAAKETHQTNLVSIKGVEMTEAGLDGRNAVVTVRVVSDQINVTRGADGQVIDGDAERVVEKTDYWTFARNTRSQDPNWQLIATHSG